MAPIRPSPINKREQGATGVVDGSRGPPISFESQAPLAKAKVRAPTVAAAEVEWNLVTPEQWPDRIASQRDSS